MVTPFDAEGGLDLDAAARRSPAGCEAHGNDGLVVAGTTGEAPVLTDDEKLSLFGRRDRGGHDPGRRRHRHQRHRATRCTSPSEASTLGVAGVLAVVPVLQPAVAGRHRGPLPGRSPRATDLPVMVYDIPIRTGRKITTATLLRLAREVPNVVGAQGRRRQPGRDGGADQLRRRTASRSTAATTR